MLSRNWFKWYMGDQRGQDWGLGGRECLRENDRIDLDLNGNGKWHMPGTKRTCHTSQLSISLLNNICLQFPCYILPSISVVWDIVFLVLLFFGPLWDLWFVLLLLRQCGMVKRSWGFESDWPNPLFQWHHLLLCTCGQGLHLWRHYEE